MGYLRVNVGRNGLPLPPPEIAEEVERYARDHGRSAKLHFVPYGGWFVEFSLRPNDPQMQLYQEGKVPEPPTERVWFHVDNPRAGKRMLRGGTEPPYLALDIYQMGASGVREFLERGNTWSGRGLYGSHAEALRKAQERNDTMRRKTKERAKEAARFEQREKRRWRFRIPFLRPLTGWLDLRQKPTSKGVVA